MSLDRIEECKCVLPEVSDPGRYLFICETCQATWERTIPARPPKRRRDKRDTGWDRLIRGRSLFVPVEH